jgi:hypothetical protein
VRAGSPKPSFPVVVTSYEIVIADVKFLQKYAWKYIIVDEGHRLKNANCKLLRELRSIPTANKLLLSGAPPLCHLLLQLYERGECCLRECMRKGHVVSHAACCTRCRVTLRVSVLSSL